jgi:hypothetical protein
MKRIVDMGRATEVMTGVSIDESHTGSGKRVDASIVNNHHKQIRVKERLLLKAKSSSRLVRRVIGQVW